MFHGNWADWRYLQWSTKFRASEADHSDEPQEQTPQFRGFKGRARQDSNLRPSLFVVILLDRQGETKQRFYQGSTGLEGTGRDTERHPVAVRLRSKPGTQPRALELKAREGYEKNSSRHPGE